MCECSAVKWGCMAVQAVRNILRECYGNKNAVDEELVNAILKPGLLVRRCSHDSAA